MDYHNESLASWSTNASFWDANVGLDGNKYWTLLQKPTLERMIQVHPDSRALELATGNGLAARWLVNAGCASVLATDGSPEMLKHAQRRQSVEEGRRIEYKLVDVTSPEALEKLREESGVSPFEEL
jgi:ubiquinone/menaquinone biosynthesis C-methylase UbiE